MKQTAVEWLKNVIESFGNKLELQISWDTMDEIIEQAKEMEKEQISIAYKEGWNCPHGEGFPETGEQYYNETYIK